MSGTMPPRASISSQAMTPERSHPCHPGGVGTGSSAAQVLLPARGAGAAPRAPPVPRPAVAAPPTPPPAPDPPAPATAAITAAAAAHTADGTSGPMGTLDPDEQA